MAGDDDLTTSRGLHVAGSALSWWATRSGGPGGQHANTSDTAVTIELDVDASGLPSAVRSRLRTAHGATVRASSSDSRSQFRNRQLARKRLGDLIDEAARPPRTRRPTKKTRGSQRRRLEAKRQNAEKKKGRSWKPGHDH
ncbi:alternative ribosome rescue aminoacyl-tRNA hydrolase ArfB [Actinospongicola halichondriae]|uniref:alternative ribosome rescue aminoacyl-tRNA hydrolase ArfB n=1 Tax=Actinospongicola halichondriae TaxID=3236844 RepID=UPI003D550B7D